MSSLDSDGPSDSQIAIDETDGPDLTLTLPDEVIAQIMGHYIYADDLQELAGFGAIEGPLAMLLQLSPPIHDAIHISSMCVMITTCNASVN